MTENNPLSFFLGKQVQVRLDGLIVIGKLFSYQDSHTHRPHGPSVLIFETECGKVLIRGKWTAISEVKKE